MTLDSNITSQSLPLVSSIKMKSYLTHRSSYATNISTAPENVQVAKLPHIWDPLNIKEKDENESSSSLEKERLYKHKKLSKKRLFCLWCKMKFNSSIEWQAHIVVYGHEKPWTRKYFKEKQKLEDLICRICNQEISLGSLDSHHCYENEIKIFKEIVNNINSTEKGAPLICSFCPKLKPFTGQGELQSHLISIHSYNDPKKLLRCFICGLKFRSKDKRVLEMHCFNIHAPSINLELFEYIHKTTLPIIARKNDETRGLYQIICTFNGCNEIIPDIYEFALHTISHHAVPIWNKDVNIRTCGYCGIKIDIEYNNSDGKELKRHCSFAHEHKVILRRYYVHKKGMLNHTFSMNNFCLFCMRNMKNHLHLQVHIMVFHSTHSAENRGRNCGICDKFLYPYLRTEPLEIKEPPYPTEMQWKASLYHERLHFEQLEHYILTDNWNIHLYPQPKLLKDLKDFNRMIEEQKKPPQGPLFNDKQYEYLRKLGKKNLENQINFEINI